MLHRKVDVSSFDRTDLVEYREDADSLPNDILFQRLHHLAIYQNGSAVKEQHTGLDHTYARLLSDIIKHKKAILDTASKKTLQKLQTDEEVAFTILARGYEFVVAFFSVLAAGGIPVPLSPHVTVDELCHVIRTSRAEGAIFSAYYQKLVTEVSNSASAGSFSPIRIDVSSTKLIEPRSMKVFAGRTRDPNKPGAIIFTSGTTGKPKGAALRRYTILYSALLQMWKTGISPGFVTLQMLPTHHVTGLILNTIPTLIGGGCVEFTRTKFDATHIWERIRQGGIRSISAVPTIYVRLLRHWDDVLQHQENRDQYKSSACAIEQFHCGSAALPVQIARRWSEVFPGTRIVERFGGTEFGNPYVNERGGHYITGSVGTKNPGVDSYLENGNEGEIYVRSPAMFSKYIYDIEGTQKSLTAEGYFRTGDVAERIDDHYFIRGRRSVDILKSGGYKVSALDIEREILQHPKVSEVAVVGVNDAEYGQRIAAAIVLKEGYTSLSLKELRDDLRSSLSSYKLPTILRIVPELKKTASMKVPKAVLKKELFETGHVDIQRWESKQSKL